MRFMKTLITPVRNAKTIAIDEKVARTTSVLIRQILKSVRGTCGCVFLLSITLSLSDHVVFFSPVKSVRGTCVNFRILFATASV